VDTYSISGACPVCAETMYISRLTCPHCGSSLEGVFEVRPSSSADAGHFGRLARLDSSQLEFVEVFLRCRGVIKNVEDMLGISYPTVKARLAEVLETMGLASDDGSPVAESRRARREILADLSAGRISIDEAHQLLAQTQIADAAESHLPDVRE